MNKVFCVHFLFINQKGEIVEMPPRTVDSLTKAGVLITIDGKPKGELIQMNWEAKADCVTWEGDTELSSSIKAMAHLIEGLPELDNSNCPIYQDSIKDYQKTKR